MLLTMERPSRKKRGISNVIVVMLSLILVVIIVSNVVLWSYQMNEFDWERMQEKVKISDVSLGVQETTFTLENEGSVTAHIVALWVNNATIHQRYYVDLVINAGDSINYTRANADIVNNASIAKVITERGNVSIFKLS